MEQFEDKSGVDPERWRAWVDRGRRNERAANRKAQMFARIVLAAGLIGLGLYVFAVR